LRAVILAKTTEVHRHQPTCSDGMAANWFALLMNPHPQEPTVPPWVTVSTKPRPGSRRGGVTGKTAKQAIAMALSTTNESRVDRHRSGRRNHTQISSTSALMM